MRKVSDEQRRKAGREVYVRRVHEGKVDNTYLSFDDWYEKYAINDTLFISIMNGLEDAENSSFHDSNSSSD